MMMGESGGDGSGDEVNKLCDTIRSKRRPLDVEC